jgi:hypothetical protein
MCVSGTLSQIERKEETPVVADGFRFNQLDSVVVTSAADVTIHKTSVLAKKK